MFQGLRQGNLFYILDKGEDTRLRTGQVVSVSNPQARFGSMPPIGQPFDSTVDVTVRVDEETLNFNQLPSQLSIANFGAGGVVVSDSREAMMAEIEGMQRASQQVLDSVEHHRKVMEACAKIRQTLDPRLAEESQMKERVHSLEKEMQEIHRTLDTTNELLAALRQQTK